MQTGLQNWLLAQKGFLLSGAFQGMAQWFQLVGRVHATGLCYPGKSIADCIGHRTGVYAPAQISGMGSSGSVWAGMPHLRLV